MNLINDSQFDIEKSPNGQIIPKYLKQTSNFLKDTKSNGVTPNTEWDTPKSSPLTKRIQIKSIKIPSIAG